METILQTRMAERDNLVAVFCAKYSDLQYADSLSADQGGLGSCYHPEDYPPVSTVRGKFGLYRSYTEMSAPGKLQAFNPELFAEQQEALKATFQNAQELGKQLLLDEFSGLVEHLQERLTPGADGKAKRVKTTEGRNVITALQEFAQNYSNRDLAGWGELEALVTRARKLCEGIGIDDLKKSETVRSTLQASMGTLKGELDKLIITAPTRALNLSDEWGTL